MYIMNSDQRAAINKTGILNQTTPTPIRWMKILLTLVLLLAARNSLADVTCQPGEAVTTHQVPLPTKVLPGLPNTIVDTWQQLPSQTTAVNCSAGSDQAGMSVYMAGATYISYGGNTYSTYYLSGNDNIAPIFEFKVNGGAWTPVSEIGSTYSYSPNYNLKQGDDITITFRYAWIRVVNINPGDFVRYQNGATNMVRGQPETGDRRGFGWYVGVMHGFLQAQPLTCSFSGSGAGNTDNLSVDLGSFTANTFTQSGWKSIGIKNDGPCNALSISMTFSNGPGYTSPAPNMFGVQMAGSNDPTLGVALRRDGNGAQEIIAPGGKVTWFPVPTQGTDYGIEAQLVKTGSGTPMTGNTGTSVIMAVVNYQ